MKFHRHGMPIDAVDTNIRPRVLVDASKELLAVWSEVRFKRKDGSWSCAFLSSRCLLVPHDYTYSHLHTHMLILTLT